MSIAPTIHRLVMDLANNALPYEGMLFYKQISELNLSYNEESLAKLDELLTKIGHKATQDARFQPEQLAKMEGGNMFYLTVAGYLGNYISRKLSKVSAIQTGWQGNADLPTRIQNEPQNLNQLTSALIFTTGDHQNYPLTAIIEKLQNATNAEKSIKEFVAVTLNKNGLSVPCLTQPKTPPQPQAQTQTAVNGGSHSSPYVNNTDSEAFKGVTPELLAQLQAQKQQLTDMHNANDERFVKTKGKKRGLSKLAKGLVGSFLDDE